VTVTIAVSGVSVAEARSPEFQESMTNTISEETNIPSNQITLVVNERRDASISAILQTANEAAATSVSNAVTTADASGDMMNTLNTKLAATAYSGSMPTACNTAVSTSSNHQSSSSDDYTVVIVVCVSIGAALLIATAVILYWQSNRTKSVSTDEVDTPAVVQDIRADKPHGEVAVNLAEMKGDNEQPI
jgi:hypothetical protein